jgi:hypothetical protein
MRAVFVLTTVVGALALGVIAAASESRLLIRTLLVGLVPVIWAVSHAIERVTGRDLWHFSAPSPESGDASSWGHESAVELRPEPEPVESVETPTIVRLCRSPHEFDAIL